MVSPILDDGEIRLYGYPFRLSAPIQPQQVQSFPGKIVVGEASRADDPLAASWVMSDWTGGILKHEMDPAVDIDRSYFSTGATWFNKQWTLGPQVRVLTTPDYGDDTVRRARAGATYNQQQYVAMDEKLCRIDSDESIDVLDDLADQAREMIVYRLMTGGSAGDVKLFIAEGDTYETWYAGALASGVASEGAISWAIWDDKLCKLDRSGEVKWTTDNASWTSLGQLPLPDDYAAKLLIFPDANGDDALHICTRNGIYFYDESATKIRATRLANLPALVDQGKASTIFQDNLYWAGGSLQVLRYTGSTVSPEGLDRDDGLPEDYRGVISTLVPTLNYLIAAFSKLTVEPLGDPIFAGDELGMATTIYATRGFGFLAAKVRTGGGWHILYDAQNIGESIYWVGQSDADDTYRLFFGVDSQLVVMDLFPDLHNFFANSLQDFRQTGYLDSPRFDAALPERNKLALDLDIGVQNLDPDTCTNGPCHLTVYYQLDRSGTWVQAADITEASDSRVYLGTDKLGLPFKTVEFRFAGERCDNPHHTPVLRYCTLNFLKTLAAREAFRLTINCSQDYAGRTPEEQLELLRRIADPDDLGATLGWFQGWVNGSPVARRVRTTSKSSIVGSGTEPRGQVSLSLASFLDYEADEADAA